MTDYYIIVDSIDENELIAFRLYKFNLEISIKPIRIHTERYETIDMIINIIEDLIHTHDEYKVYILGDDMFIRNIFDNDINNFSHLKINYSKHEGYRVFYTIYNTNNEHSIIELLDISASGIMRYIRKIKVYS